MSDIPQFGVAGVDGGGTGAQRLGHFSLGLQQAAGDDRDAAVGAGADDFGHHTGHNFHQIGVGAAERVTNPLGTGGVHGEEPLEIICEEIAKHVRSEQHAECRIVLDRGDAIRQAILEANQKTVILITGKGNETRQKRGIEYIPCPSDVEYVKHALEQYDNQHRVKFVEG